VKLPDLKVLVEKDMKPSLILHPVSYSPSGRSALAKALALARWYQADLHVLELRGGQPRDPLVRDLTSAGVEPHFAEFVESVGSDGVRISAVEVSGDDVLAVVNYARRANADLVVVANDVGSHSPNWRPKAGTKDLARLLPCETLAVPAAHDARLYERAPFTTILCATDLSSTSTKAVERASSLAQQACATLTLLHVQEEVSYGSTSAVERKLRADRVSSRAQRTTEANLIESREIDTIIARGVVYESIVETASRIDSDLIVIGRTEHDFVNRTVVSSTGAAVLRTASCPVLVVPAHRVDPVLVAVGMIPAAAHRPVFPRPTGGSMQARCANA
jgi:nucleotide-binding universal stress UspA family protein